MHKRLKQHLLLAVMALAGLSACGESREGAQEAGVAPGQAVPPPASLVTSAQVPRSHDPERVLQGGGLYQQHCAECHGQQGQGAFNWRQPGPDGKYPPPPLNGTGHAWHHPYAMLAYVIKNGSPGGQGNMPAWGGKLSDQEVADVIEWFQSQWPDELYAAWYRNDQRARQ